MASEVLGREVTRDVVADDAFRASLAERMPEGRIAFVMGYFLAARAGAFAAGDGTLARLIGRTPETMEAVLRRSLAP